VGSFASIGWVVRWLGHFGQPQTLLAGLLYTYSSQLYSFSIPCLFSIIAVPQSYNRLSKKTIEIRIIFFAQLGLGL
jgi:hypothetical protein